MTLSAVCARLEISRTSAKRLIPKLKGYRVGRLWRFDEADVEAFIASQKYLVERRASLPKTAVLLSQAGYVKSDSQWPGTGRYS